MFLRSGPFRRLLFGPRSFRGGLCRLRRPGPGGSSFRDLCRGFFRLRFLCGFFFFRFFRRCFFGFCLLLRGLLFRIRSFRGDFFLQVHSGSRKDSFRIRSLFGFFFLFRFLRICFLCRSLFRARFFLRGGFFVLCHAGLGKGFFRALGIVLLRIFISHRFFPGLRFF